MAVNNTYFWISIIIVTFSFMYLIAQYTRKTTVPKSTDYYLDISALVSVYLFSLSYVAKFVGNSYFNNPSFPFYDFLINQLLLLSVLYIIIKYYYRVRRKYSRSTLVLNLLIIDVSLIFSILTFSFIDFQEFPLYKIEYMQEVALWHPYISPFLISIYAVTGLLVIWFFLGERSFILSRLKFFGNYNSLKTYLKYIRILAAYSILSFIFTEIITGDSFITLELNMQNLFDMLIIVPSLIFTMIFTSTFILSTNGITFNKKNIKFLLDSGYLGWVTSTLANTGPKTHAVSENLKRFYNLSVEDIQTFSAITISLSGLVSDNEGGNNWFVIPFHNNLATLNLKTTVQNSELKDDRLEQKAPFILSLVVPESTPFTMIYIQEIEGYLSRFHDIDIPIYTEAMINSIVSKVFSLIL